MANDHDRDPGARRILGYELRADELANCLVDLRSSSRDVEELVEALGDARDWQSSVDAPVAVLLEAIEAAIQSQLGAHRVAERARAVAGRRERDPIRARLLVRIAKGGVSPSRLAEELSTAPAVVSRELRVLKEQGLVEQRSSAEDGRIRVCFLTGAGYRLLAEEYAFERPEVAPADSADGAVAPKVSAVVAEQFLSSRLKAAVAARRRDGDLSAIADDLRRVVREAERYGAVVIAVQARAELAVTVAKLGAATEFSGLVAEFDEIASGNRSGYGREAIVPAVACRNYVSGRTPQELSGADLVERGRSLGNAEEAFMWLSRGEAAPAWEPYHGLALVAFAHLMCERTEHGRAVQLATEAARVCRERDDSWALAKAFCIEGTARRLRGTFDDALDPLRRALDLAEGEKFERLSAEILFQLGDTHRCMNELDLAERYLEESRARSIVLGLSVTDAFAQSALGAVAYAREQYSQAIELLRRAHERFTNLEHLAGAALSSSRRARAGLKVGADADVLQKEIVRVIRLYGRLKSPAGVAAGFMHWAEFQGEQGHDRAAAASKLTNWVGSAANRPLIALDPWVPKLLSAFADRVGAEDLSAIVAPMVSVDPVHLEQASINSYQAIIDDPQNVLSGEATTTMLVVAEPADGGDPPNEMAGEPRRDVDQLRADSGFVGLVAA